MCGSPFTSPISMCVCVHLCVSYEWKKQLPLQDYNSVYTSHNLASKGSLYKLTMNHHCIPKLVTAFHKVMCPDQYYSLNLYFLCGKSLENTPLIFIVFQTIHKYTGPLSQMRLISKLNFRCVLRT